MRGHEALRIEEFNGWWARGDEDSCPPDHWPDCNNVEFIQSGFKTRSGLDTYIAQRNPVRIYTYVRDDGESLLVLDTDGNLWHCSNTNDPPYSFLVLSIPAMTDFGFTPIAGRAFITPCDGRTGLQNEFIYIYDGKRITQARRAGGAPPIGSLTLNAVNPGNVEDGVHIFGVVYETDTGYLTAPSPLSTITTVDGGFQVDISDIPISPDTFVVKRHIVVSKSLDPSTYTGDVKGYQLFFVPLGVLSDNTSTSITVDFFDADLLDDASHLIDNFTNIPAGVGLGQYHGRLLSWAEHDNISLVRVSAPGEPEAISQLDGLLILNLDGNPITNAHEFRDILYVFKKTRTVGYSDNADVPSSWEPTVIDEGIGASVHGIATVLDSGGVNIDYLVVVDYSGIMMFNGSYIKPELSWKIYDFWAALPKDTFYNIQIANNTLDQVLFITLPTKQMLIGDYKNGMDPKNIRWAKWSFDIETTTIALIEINKLIIGSKAQFVIVNEQIPTAPDTLQEV